MSVTSKPWSELPTDNPIPLLTRTKLITERNLVARILLEKGCVVKLHHHESEQTSILVSGRAVWKVGPEEAEVEMNAGEIIHFPSNYPHGILALEDCIMIDVVSPNAAMGVDSQGKS